MSNNCVLIPKKELEELHDEIKKLNTTVEELKDIKYPQITIRYVITKDLRVTSNRYANTFISDSIIRPSITQHGSFELSNSITSRLLKLVRYVRQEESDMINNALEIKLSIREKELSMYKHHTTFKIQHLENKIKELKKPWYKKIF